MSYRGLLTLGVLAVATASVSPPVVSVAAQAPTATATYTPPRSTYKPPRTPWGDPDLQGVYDYQSIIALQRPAELAGRTTLTDAELVQWAKRLNGDPCGVASRKDERCTEAEKQRDAKKVGYYNEYWMNRNFVKDNRTSLIVDPADGRIPPLTPAAEKRRQEIVGTVPEDERSYATWEDFSTFSRCIAQLTPNGPAPYNTGTYLMQSPGWVLIVRERLDTRMIPLDGRPHLDQSVRQWQGDSRGHWEGSTLVVDTTNFTDKQQMGGESFVIPGGIPMGNIHLTERFVPISAKRLDYYATLEDPKTWTKPWTFMVPWENQGTSYQMYEFACNEDNYSIGNALRGDRALGR